MSSFPKDNHVRKCPYCGVRAMFTMKATGDGHLLFDESRVRMHPDNPLSVTQINQTGLFKCVSCGGPVLIRAHGNDLSELVVLPNKILKASEEIPGKIRKIFIEALNCYEVEAWNATATMTRRAVQEAVIDKGATGEYLFNQITNLEEQRIITPALAQWAHDIRGIGRDGAHADVLTDVTDTDAKYAIDFTEEILNHLYVMPARVISKRPREDT